VTDLDDRALAARVLADEADGPGAFRALHDRHCRELSGFLAALAGDEAADALLEETFLRVHRSLDRYEPDRSFRAWIYQVARNAALDALRLKKKEFEPRERAGPPPLPEEARALLMQRALGMGVAELADSWSCPGDTLAARLEAAVALAGGDRAPAAPHPRDPSPLVRERIAAGIERARAPGPALRVLLACTYCHATLARNEARYCAGCLAPHHADCFATHGRCSVPGCGETRTVEPRARPPRRRGRFALAAIAALGTAAAAATVLRPVSAPPPAKRTFLGYRPAPAAPALAPITTGERVGPPPAYPWTEDDHPLRRQLEARRIETSFEAASLLEVVKRFWDRSGVAILVDPSIDGEAVKVDLRVRDRSLWEALLMVLEHTGLAMVLDHEHVWIGPRSRLGPDAFPTPFVVASILEAGPEGRSPLRQRLAWQSATADFEKASLRELLDWVRELADCDISLPPAVAKAARRVTYHGTARIDDLLDATLGAAGLTWEAHGGVIWVKGPPPPQLGPGIEAVALSARGITVPDLVRELSAQEIETVASPAAWASPGTFSLSVTESLGALVATISSRTSLHAWIARAAPDREVLVLDGEVASVTSALSVPAPAFAGAAADLSDLRLRLASELAARSAARSDPRVAVEELYARERAVDLSANAILTLARRVAEVTRSKERWEGALLVLGAQQEKLEAARNAIFTIQETHSGEERAKRAEIEAHVRTRPDPVALRLRYGEMVKVLPRGDEEVLGEDRVAAKVRESVDAWEGTLSALNRQVESIRRTGNAATARARFELAREERREAVLRREVNRAEADMTVLRRLELGARLAAAERE
jgi:RNA polymerase sigma factor (sigma-70 family)